VTETGLGSGSGDGSGEDAEDGEEGGDPPEPLALLSRDPGENAVSVAPGAEISLVFDRAAEAAPGADLAADIGFACGSGPVSFTPAFSGAELSLTPAADLPAGAACTVTVPADAVLAIDDGGSFAGASWSFSTLGPGAFAWGEGDNGRLGVGGTADAGGATAIPAPGVGFGGWQALAAGWYHSCGIESGTGALYCWGRGEYNELGDGAPTTDRTGPYPVTAPPTGPNAWTAVVAGWGHSCALQQGTGAAFCWGFGYHGALGNGSNSDRADPYPVSAPSGQSNDWKAIDAGEHSTCAVLSSNGAAYCWGKNDYGQVGNGGSSSVYSPALVLTPSGGSGVWQSISIATEHACGIEAVTGKLYCWGSNFYGRIGDGNTNNSPRPTPVPVNISPNTWLGVSTGYGFSCGIHTGGAAYCWGNSGNGQLGNGNGTQFSPNDVAAPAGYGNNWQGLFAGNYHVCAIHANGNAYCWGRDSNKELGDGGGGDQAYPQLLPGGHSFVQIAAGDKHNLAR
jgi:alpha-tubulin suppressor-like RCC1 family protein